MNKTFGDPSRARLGAGQAGSETSKVRPITPANALPGRYSLRVMPEVFATGFLVGFLEWACVKAVNPHLDWPAEQTVGTRINVSHSAATPPGMEVVANVELIAVNGRSLVFAVRAHDALDVISEGQHERYVIVKERFDARVLAKRGGG